MLWRRTGWAENGVRDQNLGVLPGVQYERFFTKFSIFHLKLTSLAVRSRHQNARGVSQVPRGTLGQNIGPGKCFGDALGRQKIENCVEKCEFWSSLGTPKNWSLTSFSGFPVRRQSFCQAVYYVRGCPYTPRTRRRYFGADIEPPNL